MKLQLTLILLVFFCGLEVAAQPDLHRLVHRSDIIAIAEVIEVSQPPGFWSGTTPARQSIRYKVLSLIRGGPLSNEVLVSHLVVRNSRTADANSPRLSEDYFSKGRRLLLFLKVTDEKSVKRSRTKSYAVWNENDGAIEPSSETLTKVKELISNKRNRR